MPQSFSSKFYFIGKNYLEYKLIKMITYFSFYFVFSEDTILGFDKEFPFLFDASINYEQKGRER
jgi:hypothetical protein